MAYIDKSTDMRRCCIAKGRLKFNDQKNCAPFDSMVVVFK